MIFQRLHVNFPGIRLMYWKGGDCWDAGTWIITGKVINSLLPVTLTASALFLLPTIAPAFVHYIQKKKSKVAVIQRFIVVARLEKFLTETLSAKVKGNSSSSTSRWSNQHSLPSLGLCDVPGSSGISRYKCFSIKSAVS